LEQQRGTYTLSTDPARLDLARIYDYLSTESYWAQGRPFEVTQRSVEHSLCFGVYHGDEQVAFARVVTDYATFAWLCDVFVLEAHRGRGLQVAGRECRRPPRLAGDQANRARHTRRSRVVPPLRRL
jgi:hypothetical protein